MATARHDPAALEQHDSIGERDRREAMGDEDRGPVGSPPLHRFVDPFLHCHVDRARCVVEHQDGRIGGQCPGQREPLALTT